MTKSLKKLGSVMLLAVFMLSTSVPAAFAESVPVDMAPFSVFNPSHVYLLDGSSTISASTGQVAINGYTTATQVVDSIGITLYLQKWTGSAWIDVGSGTALSTTNASSYTASPVNKATVAGTYYRVRSIHWANESGVYEQGEYFSNTVLGK